MSGGDEFCPATGHSSLTILKREFEKGRDRE
jgi:hypothetical protein